MENKTALMQLMERIPSAQEIKTAILEGDMDEKMLDEWLWEKIFKGIDYLAIEQKQIEAVRKEAIEAALELAADYALENYEAKGGVCIDKQSILSLINHPKLKV